MANIKNFDNFLNEEENSPSPGFYADKKDDDIKNDCKHKIKFFNLDFFLFDTD